MNRWRRAHYIDTAKHKVWLFWYVFRACRVLLWRAIIHDLSKFSKGEVIGFEQSRPIFERAEYGSPEYQTALDTLGPSLAYHYQANTHHPEHFDGDVYRMSPFDQLEMLCDWVAASRRKSVGIYKSLDININRFGLSDVTHESYLAALGELGL